MEVQRCICSLFGTLEQIGNRRKENDYEYFRTMRKMQAKQLMHDVLENKQQEMSAFCPKNKRRPHPVNER